jgi:drug/metabolite transporter (DMT)-like permease
MESKPLSKTKGSASKWKGIALVTLATFFTAAGLIVFKLGAENFSFSFSILLNYYLIVGVVLYIIGAVLLISSFKHGDLSSLYPFISLSYVWTFLYAAIFLGENTHAVKVLGCILIIGGVSLLGIKGGHK